MPRDLFERPGPPTSRTFLPQIGQRPYLPTIMRSPGTGVPQSLQQPLQPAMGATYPWLGTPQFAPQSYVGYPQTMFEDGSFPPSTVGGQGVGAQSAAMGWNPATGYATHLPTVMRRAPAWANADPWLRELYTPMTGGASIGAQAQVGGALVDRSGAQRLTTEGATTPGGRVEPKFSPAPPDIDAAWWKQFQVEHGGEDPKKFYARTGEGIDEALEDRDWGNRFAQMYGRGPSEYDWEEHWYATRAYGRPQGPGWRRKSKSGATDDALRPPLYVPQQTAWRL